MKINIQIIVIALLLLACLFFYISLLEAKKDKIFLETSLREEICQCRSSACENDCSIEAKTSDGSRYDTCVAKCNNTLEQCLNQ